jgi:hypothetical protein
MAQTVVTRIAILAVVVAWRAFFVVDRRKIVLDRRL